MKKFFKKTTAIVLAALTLGTNFSQASATSSINFTNKKIWTTIVAAGGGLITGGGIIAIVLSKYYNYELTTKQESLDRAHKYEQTALNEAIKSEDRSKNLQIELINMRHEYQVAKNQLEQLRKEMSVDFEIQARNELDKVFDQDIEQKIRALPELDPLP